MINKRIAKTILLAPHGVVRLGSDIIRWSSYDSELSNLFPGEGIKRHEIKVKVTINEIRAGVYNITWLREYAKA